MIFSAGAWWQEMPMSRDDGLDVGGPEAVRAALEGAKPLGDPPPPDNVVRSMQRRGDGSSGSNSSSPALRAAPDDRRFNGEAPPNRGANGEAPQHPGMGTSTPPGLSIEDWLKREIPGPDFLLGELFSTTCRAMLVGPTGLGKTSFCLAVALAMAVGCSFLHWTARRPARILYVDGEMSRRLLKARLADAARRQGAAPKTLNILSRDDIEEMPPLNTPQGQAFIETFIKRIGGADFVIFDNIQSLVAGDMKEEEAWAQILPWVRTLTRQSTGQLWVQHTGHNETHAYGTKTREWQLDTVMLLKRIERPETDIAFRLSFTKCRERTPQNRADFAVLS